MRIWQWSTFIHAHPWFTPMFCLVAQIICCWLITNTHTHTHTHLPVFANNPFAPTPHTQYLSNAAVALGNQVAAVTLGNQVAAVTLGNQVAAVTLGNQVAAVNLGDQVAPLAATASAKASLASPAESMHYFTVDKFAIPLPPSLSTISFAVQTNTVNRHNPQSQQLAK